MLGKLEKLSSQFKAIKLIVTLALIIGLIIVIGFALRIVFAILMSKIFWLIVGVIAIYHLFIKNKKSKSN